MPIIAQNRVVWHRKSKGCKLRELEIEPGIYDREEIVMRANLQGIKNIEGKISLGQIPGNWVMVNSAIIKIFDRK